MTEPILVIHGVANRDQDLFKKNIGDLQARLNASQPQPDRWKLIPVYWGNLGAREQDIQDTLPEPAKQDSFSELAQELLSGLLTGAASEGRQKQVVSQVAADEIHQSTLAAVHSAAVIEHVQQAINEGWSRTQWLKLVQNRDLLDEIGRTIGLGAREYAAVHLLTGGIKLEDLRGFTGGLLSGLDNSIGSLVGGVIGKLERYLRTELLPRTTEFVGDVLVYQRQRDKIQQVIWNAIQENANGSGTEQNPISVLAHSLGGVIAFDTATNGQPPLWIKSFITFGSQASYFQIMDPERNNLPHYSRGTPIQLPPTIAKWTNLWEPLDILAFAENRVFQLHSGALPQDILVPHLALSGPLPHSSYWTHPFALTRIAEALG